MTDDSSPLLVDAHDHKLILTLNRPEALNAHNQGMRDALIEAYERFDGDDDLLFAIIDGSRRAFSAGADLKEQGARRSPSDGAAATRSFDGNSHFSRLEITRKPVIACIHGYAVGGGLEVALSCDLRFATKDVLLVTPEARTQGGRSGDRYPPLALQGRHTRSASCKSSTVTSRPRWQRRRHWLTRSSVRSPALGRALDRLGHHPIIQYPCTQPLVQQLEHPSVVDRMNRHPGSALATR